MLEHYQDELEGMVAVLRLVETVGKVPVLKGAVLRSAYSSFCSKPDWWLSYPGQKPGKFPSLALAEAQAYQIETSVFRISTHKSEF